MRRLTLRAPAPPASLGDRSDSLSRRVAIVVFLFAWTLTTHGKYSASGDEPHYLMIAHSILVDGDMNVADNYQANDGRHFGHDRLEMGLHASPARNGDIRPIHDVGLAVALVPVYSMARGVAQLASERLLRRFRMDRGLFTYSIVSLCLISLTAVGLMSLGRGLASAASAPAAAFLIGAVGISPPVVSHSFLIFPEAIAFAVTCFVVWMTLKPVEPNDAPKLMAVSLALGLLPWTHHKFLLYAFALAFVLVQRRWSQFTTASRAYVISSACVFIIPQIALLLWTRHEWGTFGGALTTSGLPFSAAMIKSGLPGLWVDRQSGLLAYAPFYAIIPASLYLSRQRAWPYIVPLLALYLPSAAFSHGWWGGFSPAARYLIPAIPCCVVAVAEALRYRTIQCAAVVLFVPQLFIDAVIWQWPRTLWPTPAGNPALESLGSVGRFYAGWLPSLRVENTLSGAAPPLLLVGLASLVLIVLAKAEGQATPISDSARR